MPKPFYGRWITIAAFFTFGIAVGIPYYGGPFFYDYYEKTFGWSRKDITFGFPLAALLTLWVGPLLVHRFSPRKLLLVGTAFTGVAFVGWSMMGGSVSLYWGLWVVYVVGYILSGPIAHQVIVSNWYRKHRGKAMAVVYLGVPALGGLVPKYVSRPITDSYGFQTALLAVGAMMVLAWPVALWVMKDRPSDIGQNPDGDDSAASIALTQTPAQGFGVLLRSRAFWLLVIGSACSIGSIGAINQHMKFVFKEQGFIDQKTLDTMWADANLLILFSSIGGRLFFGWMADRFPKKWAMMITYFLVAGTIPLLKLVTPDQPGSVYVFAVLFGFGMGADYMLIPLMAAEQFGVNTLARAMAIILPTDTIGQTWFPFLVAAMRDSLGGYSLALNTVFITAAIGAIAVALLPKHGPENETLHVPDPHGVAARR